VTQLQPADLNSRSRPSMNPATDSAILLTCGVRNRSIRRIAADRMTSSVHRHRRKLITSNQHPSRLWEMPSGHQWLQRRGGGICIRRQARQRHAVEFFPTTAVEPLNAWGALAGVMSQAGKADSELSPRATKQLQQVPTKRRSVSVRMKPCLTDGVGATGPFIRPYFFGGAS